MKAARRGIAVLLIMEAILWMAPAASGDDHAGAGTNSFWASLDEGNEGTGEGTPDVSHPQGQVMSSPMGCNEANQCHGVSACSNGQIRTWQWFQPNGTNSVKDQGNLTPCAVTVAGGQPQLTPGMIAEAFRRVPLSASPLRIQPPHGQTLVNFDTIFFTTNNKPFTRVIGNLLGHRVEFRITPAEFTWIYGDGHWTTTSDAGRPFTTQEAIALDISHRYLTKDVFYPRLDTTYTATYRVDGGAWAPVSGTVTIEGDPVRLETLTATPVLVDDPTTG